jgi:hypothetical protein
MNFLIALFNSESSVPLAVKRLREAGIAEDRISIISSPNSINKLLRCDPACVIRNYTAWGATIGIGIYAICGIAAALCQCNLIHYGREYGVFAFVGAVLAGTVIGGFIGILVGVGEAEKKYTLILARSQFRQ